LTKKQTEAKVTKGKPNKKPKLIAAIAIVVIAAIITTYAVTSKNNVDDNSNYADSKLTGSWMDVHGVGVFLSEADDSLYLATHNGLFKKEPDGWKRIGNDKSDLMGFTINRAKDGVMYSSGHPPGMGGNLGFRKSVDGGNTWQLISNVKDTPVDFHAMTTGSSDPNLVYGSPGGGFELFISHDEGTSWTPLSPPDRIISIAADPLDANIVYAGTITGLFVSTDQGKTWNKLDHEQIRDLVVTGLGFSADGETLYAFKILPHGEGFIVKSDDGGKTWANTSGQIPDAKGVWNFAPGRDGEIYAITSQQTASGIAASIYRSSDDGATWIILGTNNEALAKSNAP
jgi:hypothetical protein